MYFNKISYGIISSHTYIFMLNASKIKVIQNANHIDVTDAKLKIRSILIRFNIHQKWLQFKSFFFQKQRIWFHVTYCGNILEPNIKSISRGLYAYRLKWVANRGKLNDKTLFSDFQQNCIFFFEFLVFNYIR